MGQIEIKNFDYLDVIIILLERQRPASLSQLPKLDLYRTDRLVVRWQDLIGLMEKEVHGSPLILLK